MPDPTRQKPPDLDENGQPVEGRLGTINRIGGDFSRGIRKDIGETGLGLTEAIDALTPGQLTSRLLSLIDYTPESAHEALGAKTTGEGVGKTAGQMLEYALAGGAGRKLLTKGLVKLLPAAKWATTAGNVAGNVLGEGGAVAGVAGLHGDEQPGVPGLAAGGLTAAGELLSRGGSAVLPPAIRALSKAHPYLSKEVLPRLGAGLATPMAGAAGYALGGPAAGGIGGLGGMGSFNLIRKLLEDALDPATLTPKAVNRVARGTRTVTKHAGTAAGATTAVARKAQREHP